MSKPPWGKIGTWAADAEQVEEEEREEAAKAAAVAASIPAVQSQDFPSIKDAVVTAKQQKKKNKMSLQEFNFPRANAVGLTPEEMLRLPSGPRERSSADEMPYGSGRLGGGFSNYGSRSSGPPPGRMRDTGNYGSEGTRVDSRRPYGGFEDEPRRGQRPDVEQSSRADEVDNWTSMKKPLPSYNSGPGGGPGPRPSRYASLGGGDSGGPSRADEVDNWTSTKKPIPPSSARSYTFRSGAGDSRPEPDRWIRDGDHERQSLSLNLSKGEDGGGVVKVNKPNPFGAARPREEVLAEKGLDWKKLDMEIEAKKPVSRPNSSQSSRPGSSQSTRSEGQAFQGTGEGLAIPRIKTNPFGEAKPREVLLEEKGVDWRKIDLKLDHRRVERPETDEEKNLKKEIEHLKSEKMPKSAEDQSSLHDIILQKEMDLELLIQELDAKIRLGQKPVERPGSGAGRFSGPAERISSHTGVYDGHRAGEFMERPRSRGTGDAWHRSADDRRPSQHGRGRGYSGGRDMERSLTRVRW